MDSNNFNFEKVMVVDDAEIDRFLAKKVLTKHAFAREVLPLDSATNALNYLSENQENKEALPDLIFLDINMPKMNGFDFLEEYKKLPESVKKKCIIVMLSSSLLPEDRELAMNNPYVCQFLNKPLTGDKLKDVGNP
ncbi:response regulator [Chitinophaga sp. CF418]|uniref:response regulator n=1 Tax=Chitinophaga sp. CF418 TaxID=1855287 RepID=UPI00091564B0|nr:response regulator [Chitinophaga sp. CF418]SHN31999.1 CheY chemotaxis protein or a CheY-like REC (receiver) domain [Chitinophaga sp. CF418]